MIGEPRTIARIVELFHIPILHTPELLREVYQQVSGSCGYDNFIRASGGARLEAAATEGGSVSRLTFMKDRLAFHEEQTNLGVESFLRRIDAVVGVATEKLSIPVFICRNITLRAVASPGGGQSSSQFIAENLLRLGGDDLAPLERPGQIIGFRMHFPPPDPKGGTHQLRIESYLRDPRVLFLEDWATFKLPVPSRDLERLALELNEVEDFLHERVTAFLNQFPRP